MSDPQSPLSTQLASAQTVVVVYPVNATHEELAVAAALTLTLQSQGKDVRLVSPQLPESTNSIIGLDQTQTELGHQNLLVSFAYDENKVDKISYHIGEESGKFYLTIKPKKGHQPLDTKSVEFSYAGMEADLLILVGVKSLESLSQLYIGYEELNETMPKIEVNELGQGLSSLQITRGSASCLSEAVGHELVDSGLAISPEAASNLLAGIEEATVGLSSTAVQAGTFDLIARLLRAGGVRPVKSKNQRSVPSKMTNSSNSSNRSIDSADINVTRSSPSTTNPPKPKETEMKVEVRRAKK